MRGNPEFRVRVSKSGHGPGPKYSTRKVLKHQKQTNLKLSNKVIEAQKRQEKILMKYRIKCISLKI
jgi:hypothetical protein